MNALKSIVVAVGSTRPPKVNAAKSAFQQIASVPEFLDSEFSFKACSAASGVSDTPRSVEETMLGAKLRVKSLQEQINGGLTPDFWLGMEGGLFTIESPDFGRRVFLQSWVYAEHEGIGALGGSPAIELPQVVLQAFGDKDFELADVMDELSQRTNTRDKGGACAILTRSLMTRQGSFEQATLSALAAFYNSAIYDR